MEYANLTYGACVLPEQFQWLDWIQASPPSVSLFEVSKSMRERRHFPLTFYFDYLKKHVSMGSTCISTKELVCILLFIYHFCDTAFLIKTSKSDRKQAKISMSLFFSLGKDLSAVQIIYMHNGHQSKFW